ncbi:MAG: hypothetical protein EB015_22695, partial [Methylocystaceae bacterium]|nr:hypothetical protein [Methylocystaceae bacterium]
EEDLVNHHQRLNEAYAEYLQQLKDKGSLEVVEKLLFGNLPLFHKIEGKDWEELGVSHHFSLGLRTKERGVQAVGLGVILEHLLTLYNVRVKYNCCVEDIQLLSKGGFAVKSDNHSPVYARYIINAAWDNNSYLEWLIKKQSPPNTSPVQHPPPQFFKIELIIGWRELHPYKKDLKYLNSFLSSYLLAPL